MIKSLHISNYALIDSIDIRFHPGLNIITGETGAGKSIILGALSLLLGERADSKTMRQPDKKSVIEAAFSAAGFPVLKQLCDENDIDWDPDTLILRREIAPNGRSRAFVNDCPVNLQLLQSVALQLIDIHSQHQNLLLASPPYQLQIIDSLAGNAEIKARFAEAYRAFRHAVHKYKNARKELEQTRDDEEFLRFQYQRLNEAELEDGEIEELEKERDLLFNMADVKAALNNIASYLTDREESMDELARLSAYEAESLSTMLDDAESLAERLRQIRIEIRDIAQSFSEHDRDLFYDPERLDAVELRLNTLYDLLRRYKKENIAELIAYRDQMKERLTGIDIGDESLRQLEVKAKQLRREALAIAAELSASRRREAERFAEMLAERAIPLGMKNLQVQIQVKETELSPNGTDQVEFLFAFNKNQELMPVGKTASGGEISRLMLSIKSIVADKMQLPSIIFDEVDTGVSGDVANRMGLLMRQIARNIQVIAITHLPQVASKGDAHFKVFKEDTDVSTVTRIKRLGTDDRVAELAIMLSGTSVDEAALANARSLISQNERDDNTTPSLFS